MNLRELANMATVREASEIVGVNFSTLHTAIYTGAVPSRKVDGRRIVDLEDVEAWNETREMGRPALPLDYSDAGEVARERGISIASARRFIQRRRKSCK